MTAYLSKRGIRIFHFIQFAKPLTDALKANAKGWRRVQQEQHGNQRAASVGDARYDSYQSPYNPSFPPRSVFMIIRG